MLRSHPYALIFIASGEDPKLSELNELYEFRRLVGLPVKTSFEPDRR